MTLVQNHQLQLSGNKYWLIIFIILFISACSPKVQKTVVKKPDVPKVEKEVEKPALKFTQANISLLVPFRLNDLKLKTATKSEIEKAAMAIDFYQGFKLGVDSAASLGLNFKLKVFDSRNSNARLDELIKDGDLTGSNLIVGPVFPESLKHIAKYSTSKSIPVVSPLAATHPNEFNNPNLISIVNNIDLHANKLGDYITSAYNPANTVVVLINPKTPDDGVMAAPIRAYFANSKKQFTFQEFASVFTMETKLIKNKKYVIIVSSDDRKFVVPTIDKLIKIKNTGLAIDLFGHPDWVKQNYNVDKLQALRTAVTSSYKIDYTSSTVNNFIRKYRQQFNFEPGEYAFKGFDIGFYFSKLLAEHGIDYLAYLTKEKYKGLHNRFSFYYDEKLGYINTSLMLLRYQNFALNIIE
ncbi:ABC transporter substrate-binding protein [Pedobacter frigoris]|uniref:Amino acid ABC transporter substrate-binding protein n=1 Tax=Pedobacter frigoris TaxID=2571272 RepID=A0A4U1CI00_9SPHI|nr:amino acid ABC transporter substrate-binding protein [Pedobacter frigoris]TKC07003.1 amino acid ABC transporter substrate-binding protein [Pedobacter frigoris]